MPRSSRLSPWTVALGLVALVAILATVTMRIEIPRHRELWLALFDAGHYPLIAALTVLLHGLVGHPVERAMGDGRRGRWGSAFFVGSVLFGVLLHGLVTFLAFL